MHREPRPPPARLVACPSALRQHHAGESLPDLRQADRHDERARYALPHVRRADVAAADSRMSMPLARPSGELGDRALSRWVRAAIAPPLRAPSGVRRRLPGGQAGEPETCARAPGRARSCAPRRDASPLRSRWSCSATCTSTSAGDHPPRSARSGARRPCRRARTPAPRRPRGTPVGATRRRR